MFNQLIDHLRQSIVHNDNNNNNNIGGRTRAAAARRRRRVGVGAQHRVRLPRPRLPCSGSLVRQSIVL